MLSLFPPLRICVLSKVWLGPIRVGSAPGRLLRKQLRPSACHQKTAAKGVRPGIPVPGMAMQQSALQGMQLGPSGRPMFMPQRFQLSQRGEMPQGVDLNLDQFNLTEVEQFAGSLPACSADAKSLEARTTLGRAFLESLRSGFGKEVSEENRELLKGIFNPALADRTEEADAFIPPDPNLSYISRVRNLVNDEQALLKKRKGAFCDRSFTPGSCGPEFPRSWTSRFTMENGVSPAVMMKLRSAMVQLQVDSTFQQSLLNDASGLEWLRHLVA